MLTNCRTNFATVIFCTEKAIRKQRQFNKNKKIIVPHWKCHFLIMLTSAMTKFVKIVSMRKK